MNLNRRVKKLEGSNDRMRIIFADECPSWEERQAIAEAYRQEHRLPPQTAIIVIDEKDRGVL